MSQQQANTDLEHEDTIFITQGRMIQRVSGQRQRTLDIQSILMEMKRG